MPNSWSLGGLRVLSHSFIRSRAWRMVSSLPFTIRAWVTRLVLPGPTGASSAKNERPWGRVSWSVFRMVSKKSTVSSTSLNSRRAVLLMISRISAKVFSSWPGTSMMMSSSRTVTAASRRPSSSTRRPMVSLAWLTARSRMLVSTSVLILKTTLWGSVPGERTISPLNFWVTAPSSLEMSAASLKCSVIIAAVVLDFSRVTLSPSLSSSSRVAVLSACLKP
jgi:hypothetical protein